MSSARDKLYGRRAGRWAGAQPVGDALDDLASLRRAREERAALERAVAASRAEQLGLALFDEDDAEPVA